MDDQALEIEVIRSSGRVKTASARWVEPGKKVLVRLPANLEAAEEQRLISQLVAKVRAGARRRDLNNDGKLPERAAELKSPLLWRAAATRLHRVGDESAGPLRFVYPR